MNTIQIKMSTVVLLATLMSGLTSCSDFLDENPTDNSPLKIFQ